MKSFKTISPLFALLLIALFFALFAFVLPGTAQAWETNYTVTAYTSTNVANSTAVIPAVTTASSYRKYVAITTGTVPVAWSLSSGITTAQVATVATTIPASTTAIIPVGDYRGQISLRSTGVVSNETVVVKEFGGP